MGDVRTSLANRRFTAYLLTAALADIGYWIAYVAQGWLVLKLTNSPFWLGTVGAASNVPFLVFSLPGGALADRFNRSALVALASAAISLVALVLAVLAQRGAITIGLLVALTFLLGTLFALSAPIDRAWMYDLVEGRGIGTATALSSLEWSVARTLGPALGGVATATIGVAAGYAALGALALPLMLLALTLARVERTRHSPCISPGEPLAPKAADERRIVAMSLLVAAFTASVIPYISFLPDIARNTLRLDARGYGLLAACGGIGSILGAMMISALGELEHKGRLVPMIVTGGGRPPGTLHHPARRPGGRARPRPDGRDRYRRLDALEHLCPRVRERRAARTCECDHVARLRGRDSDREPRPRDDRGTLRIAGRAAVLGRGGVRGGGALLVRRAPSA